MPDFSPSQGIVKNRRERPPGRTQPSTRPAKVEEGTCIAPLAELDTHPYSESTCATDGSPEPPAEGSAMSGATDSPGPSALCNSSPDARTFLAPDDHQITRAPDQSVGNGKQGKESWIRACTTVLLVAMQPLARSIAFLHLAPWRIPCLERPRCPWRYEFRVVSFPPPRVWEAGGSACRRVQKTE